MVSACGHKYSERGRALGEWELVSSDYRIEQAGGGLIVTNHPPRRARNAAPCRCRDCAGSSGVPVAIQNVLDADRIRFRVDDLQRRSPPPFPVFRSWTRFEEDIHYD